MRTARWTGGWLLVAGFVAALFFSGSGVAAEADAGFTPIFNGTSLEGWEGKDFWTVKDGAIVGTTTAEKPTEGNTFLIWQQGTLDDFGSSSSTRSRGQQRHPIPQPPPW